MNNKIDNFGIGAASLQSGVQALQKLLGVETPRGGKHDTMGTHNCVMQAGGESFLEILAIDPDAPPPCRARWFSMDDPTTIAVWHAAARFMLGCWYRQPRRRCRSQSRRSWRDRAFRPW